jgi:multidrug resistance efflux pump
LRVVAMAGLVFFWKGMPLVHEYFSHVETDDAYVTGDPSTVGSRISEVVERVFVKDNDFVEKRSLLVTLDRNRLQLQVDHKRAEMNQKRLELDQLAKTADSDRASLDQARSIILVGIAGIHEAVKAFDAKQEEAH